ncbi:MAG: thioredoxin domain-containing protein [Pedococcus sp.]
MVEAVPARRSPVVPVVVAVVAVLLAIVAFVASRPQPQSSPAGAGPPSSGAQAATETGSGQDPAAGLARRTPDDPMAVGKADAPVVMVAYSEFQCPFCGTFARDTEPGLVKKYVDTGVLRIEWRDFPYLGQESMTAALAGRAAAQQGDFWAFHDALYADQQPVNAGKLTKEFLGDVAARAGLDGAQLKKDMERPELTEAVSRDAREGQSIGVTGTPAFIINGQPVIGAQPSEVFEKAIEDATRR